VVFCPQHADQVIARQNTLDRLLHAGPQRVKDYLAGPASNLPTQYGDIVRTEQQSRMPSGPVKFTGRAKSESLHLVPFPMVARPSTDAIPTKVFGQTHHR